MRIVFIGGVQFSELALHRLMKLKAQVVGVCTAKLGQPDSDRIDLAAVCDDYGLNVRHCDDINDQATVDWITALAPDVIFCFGWSRLIKAPLLQLPRLGVIGFHPSALPQNRGRHPIIWALALGLTKTASTFFVMDEGADSGPIVSQRPVEIRDDDDAATLYQRITDVALEQIEDMVPRLANGTAARKEQDETLATIWRKRGYADGQVDWRMDAGSIRNLVRALARPYPGAHFLVADREVKLWRVEVEADSRQNIEPGRVIAVDSRGPLVKAGKDAIRILELQPSITLAEGQYL